MLTLSLLCALAAAKDSNWKLLSSASPSVDTLWSNFVKEYGIHDLNSPPDSDTLTATQASYETLQARKALFSETVEYITAHNTKWAAGESTYRLGLNQFADLSKSELAFYTSPKIGRPDDAAEISPSRMKEILSAPKSNKVDWRTDDLDIHNQQSCGSCWAFATSAMVENRWYHENGEVIEVASQEMVDCVDSCWGCQGGYSYYATDYIAENGIADEDTYPYVGKTQNCYASGLSRTLSVGDITAEYVAASGESDMASIVANGAMTIAIDVVYDFFYLADGVFEPSSCSRWSSDYVGAHAISAVGYTNNYWIIQNSWGNSWGDYGYGYISKGSNICNIGTWDNWSWISVSSSTNTDKTENMGAEENASTTDPPASSKSTDGPGLMGPATVVTLIVVLAVALLLGVAYKFHSSRRRAAAYKEFDAAQETQPNYGGAQRSEIGEAQL